MSDTRGKNWRQMFSTNVTLGASNVAEAHDVTVRVDDLVTYTLHLDPAQNGQVAGEYTINW